VIHVEFLPCDFSAVRIRFFGPRFCPAQRGVQDLFFSFRILLLTVIFLVAASAKSRVRFPAVSPQEEALGDFCFCCSSSGSLTVLLLRFFSQFFLLVPAAACHFFQLRFLLAPVLASEIWFWRAPDPFSRVRFLRTDFVFSVVPRARLADSCFRFEFPPVRPSSLQDSIFFICGRSRPRCRHLLAARAGALTEWPGASAAGLVQPRSELCSSFRFAYPLDMLSIFFML
jgi:hypothetical protein